MVDELGAYLTYPNLALTSILSAELQAIIISPHFILKILVLLTLSQPYRFQ